MILKSLALDKAVQYLINLRCGILAARLYGDILDTVTGNPAYIENYVFKKWPSFNVRSWQS